MAAIKDETITDIVEAFQSPLSGFIHSRINSIEEADDILQEVWYQLSKSDHIAELESVSGWLYHIARNKIIDSYRKKSPDLLDDYLYDEEEENSYIHETLISTDDSPDTLYLRDQFWEEFYEALDTLPEKQREVFLRNEMGGITLREIAEKSGENLKTIISRKGYAVRHLRERLQDLFDEWMDE